MQTLPVGARCLENTEHRGQEVPDAGSKKYHMQTAHAGAERMANKPDHLPEEPAQIKRSTTCRRPCRRLMYIGHARSKARGARHKAREIRHAVSPEDIGGMGNTPDHLPEATSTEQE